VSRSAPTPAAFRDLAARRIGELVGACCPDRPGAGLVVALSGGPDSVALLLAAHAWAGRAGRPLAAAHLNHGLRPGAAEADTAFCRELCRTLDVPLTVESADVRPEASKRGAGLEEAGRHLRRRFLRRVLAADDRLGCIATGHHRDDQVETILMRLFRGTGPDGMGGMQPVSGPFIHPLLPFGRDEIVAFLAHAGQPWRTDATNLDGDNLRARLRREFVPLVRDLFGPGCEANPLRLAGLLADDAELLDRQAGEAAARLAGDDGLDVPGLLDLHPALARRVLRRWLGVASDGDDADGHAEGLARVHVDEVLAWLRDGQSGTSVDLPGGRRLRRAFERLQQGGAAAPSTAAADYRINVAPAPDGAPPPRDRREALGDPADPATWRLTCPASCLQGNLQVRPPRPGDRIEALGLGGSKKLSDLLREERIPAEARPGVLVIADAAGVLWVVGMARAERTRMLPHSGRMVTISVTTRITPIQQGNDAE
jgi:tRNA(Ile)-lysidine synthase